MRRERKEGERRRGEERGGSRRGGKGGEENAGLLTGALYKLFHFRSSSNIITTGCKDIYIFTTLESFGLLFVFPGFSIKNILLSEENMSLSNCDL